MVNILSERGAPHSDNKVINLSSFPLEMRHIQLLQRGMFFSPVSDMEEFTVYKDVVLFLRKVFFRSLYQQGDATSMREPQLDTDDQQALAILNSLLEESEGHDVDNPIMGRQANLNIKSKKMPSLNKNRWLNIFLEMVQKDLEEIPWKIKNRDNLFQIERKALKELKEASSLSTEATKEATSS